MGKSAWGVGLRVRTICILSLFTSIQNYCNEQSSRVVLEYQSLVTRPTVEGHQSKGNYTLLESGLALLSSILA